jgi:prolyl oligopeptidase
MLSPNSSFDVVVPESDAFVRDVSASSKAVYVLEQLNGRGTVRALSFDEKPVVTEVKLPVDGPVRRLVADPLTANALVEVEGWTQASTWFYVDARGRASNARLPVPSVGSLPGVVAEEELVSNAGIQVPLTVVRRKDIPLDGSAPTLLLGYGAYGTSVGPYFAPAWLAWLERGGIFAVAHVRGGGERGETWHRDGMLSKKQNGIDDFLACAQYLVQNHYTSSAKLVAFAVSAGGVLAGSAIVQRPELFGAAVLESALCNPLRLDHMALGPQNAAEFGSASSEDGYRTLLAIDPYMQVRESARYPRVLFLVGANDTRVPPWQSAKFAARLQASGGDGADSLLRVYADEGHGVAGAASVRARMIADEYAFGFLATSGVIPKRMNEPKSRD